MNHPLREELEREVSELYKALDNRDYEISQLEQRLSNVIEANDDSSRDDQVKELEVELEDTRKEAAEYRQTASELEIHLNQIKNEVDDLRKDNKHLKEQVKSQQDVIESQKKKMVAAERQSLQNRRKHRDETDEQYRLELENQKLRQAIQELEENEEDLVCEIENLAKEREVLEVENHEQRFESETLKLTISELARTRDASDSELILIRRKLDAEQKKNNEWTAQIQVLKEQHEVALRKVKNELLLEREKNELLDSKAAISLGAQREKEKNGEVNDLALDLEMSQIQLEKIQLENNSLIRKNETIEMTLKGLLVEIDLLKKEKNTIKNAHNDKTLNDLKNARQNDKTAQSMRIELEKKLADIQDELDHAEKRNSRYEEKYDLFDAVKFQKKLESDIRRRDYDLRKNLILLGEKDEQINLLKKACNTMRHELGQGISLNENELKAMVAIDENSLQSQNRELTIQIEKLEKDRVNLMKRLRENAALIGKNGFKFVGLNAEQIMQVTDFASSIREGSLTLPLNDRSLKLASHLSKLKAEKMSDPITIDRLEREIQTIQVTRGLNEESVESELCILRKMLLDIQSQNKALRNRIEILCVEHDQDGEHQVKHKSALSPFDKQRIERIVGESLQPDNVKTLNQFQCFLKEYVKLESELSIIKATLNRCTKSSSTFGSHHQLNTSVTLPTSNKVKRRDICIQATVFSEEATRKLNTTITAMVQTDGTSIKNQLPSTAVQTDENSYNIKSLKRASVRSLSISTDPIHQQDVHCQVCILEKSNPTQEELNDKLKKAALELNLFELKTKRLKNALRHATSPNDYEKRIIMAQASVEQLKIIIDKKNKIIQKYRSKCISSVSISNEYHVKNSCISNNFKVSDESDTQQFLTTESVLVARLNESSNLLKNKEDKITQLLNQLEVFKESACLSEKRHSNLTMEVSKLKLTNSELQKTLDQVENYAKEIGNNQLENKASYEMERNNLEQLLEDAKLESKVKEDKMERMKTCMIQLRNRLKECEESAKNVPIMESEIKRMKIELSVSRRSRDHWEKALLVSKSKAADVIDDMEKLEMKVNSLKYEATEARKTKLSAVSKSKRLVKRLKEVKESANKGIEDMKLSSLNEQIEEYKKRISSLQKDNIKLRGIVASYTIKYDNKGNIYDSSDKNLKSRKIPYQDRKSMKQKVQKDYTDKSCQTGSVAHSEECQSEKSHKMVKAVKDLQCPSIGENKFQSIEECSNNTRQDHLIAENKEERYNCIRAKKSYDRDVDTSATRVNELLQQNRRYSKAINDLKDCMMRKETENERLKLQLDRTVSMEASNRTSRKNNSLDHDDHQIMHEETTDCKENDLVTKLKEEVQGIRRQLSVAKKERKEAIEESDRKISNLHVMNKRLRNELSSFTLEFFEEIEDLKFKYSEAKKKLELYGDE